ncbi:hypothetical protein CHARACLAT_013712 [Characodon lateralis]|uniref:Uncharacterized protein n=1 Tax=Characodon lateralis TaxID=208331 RepID=A0ABU7CR42_9TELE|nr:hypothetical protein [Characodon lateralis]
MFKVVILLKDKPLLQSEVSNVFSPSVTLYSAPFVLPFNSDQLPCHQEGKASPEHDAATTMCHCGEGVSRVTRSVNLISHIVFCTMAIKAQFWTRTTSSTFAVSFIWLLANRTSYVFLSTLVANS